MSAIEHFRAAWLFVSRESNAALPVFAALQQALFPFGFSSTKNTREMVAKNVVYMVNQ